MRRARAGSPSSWLLDSGINNFFLSLHQNYRLMKRLLPFLVFIIFSGTAYSQQRYLYQFTLPNGTQQFVNMDRIRLVYDREPSGARLILGGPTQIIEVNQTRGYILSNSCGNLVSAVERYYEYTGFKTRGFLFNPVFVSQVDRLPDGRSRITFFLPNQAIETQTPYNTIAQLLDKCVNGSGGSQFNFIGDSTITITQSADSVFFSVNPSAANATNLTFTGSNSPYTLNSSTGSDVTFSQSGIVSLSLNGNELTIGASEVDGSVTNELQTLSHASDATSHTVTLSNGGGGLKLVEGSNITLTTTDTNQVTIAATSVSDGNGIYSGSGTVPGGTFATMTDTMFFVGLNAGDFRVVTGNSVPITTETSTLRTSSNATIISRQDIAGTNSITVDAAGIKLSAGSGDKVFVQGVGAAIEFANNNNPVDTANLQYSSDVGDFIYGGNDGTQLEVGQKHVWYVKNDQGGALVAGDVVYASGTVGASGRIKVKKYIANGTIPSKFLLGIVAKDFNDGEDGYVVDFGKIRGLNTSSFSEGAVLYASTSTAGALTATRPNSPNFEMPIAFVVSSGNPGTIAVRVTPGQKLGELHNVDTLVDYTTSNGHLLTYNSSTGIWGAAAPADGSATNELQTLSHASDATSHTVTLSDGGGSLKLIEGSNITLTTNNTNEVTIAATGGGGGATDLTFTGSASPFTLNSSTGTDVTFAQGGIVSLSRNNNELTIGATINDASLTYAKIQNSDSLSVLGRAGNTNGVLDEIIAASDHQVLRRSGTGIGFGAVALNQANAVTGTLAAGNGGTGNAFFAVSGPASSVKTFTFPNASATVLTTNAAVTVGQGGTGRTTQTAYMPIIGGTTTTGAQQSVATGSTAGQALLYQGTSANPSFGAINLAGGSNIVTGVLPSANGGDQTVSLTGTGITVGGTYPSFTLTAADQSATNELQTLSHASDATSHTVTLSDGGGSLKLIEGSNITLTTNNTNEITIAATGGGGGATDLTFTGSASPFTLNSSTGTDVTFAQGGIVSLSRSNNELTISATIDDASLTYAKIQNSDSLSVLGRAGNTNGVLDEIIAASDHQVLRRSGTGIGFGAVALNQANAVTGTLAAGNGGTGNAFFAVSGPASSVKTFTFPNASATVLTTYNIVTPNQGGTGQSSYTNGQLLIGNTTGNTLTKATLTAGHHTTVTNGAGSIAIGTAQDTLCMVIACSDETTNLTTGTKVTFRAPFRMNIVSLGANVNTAPTGTGITVNIKEGPSDIMSTKLTIADGSFTSVGGSPPVITDTDIAADAECTIDIDAVGSTTAGKGLKVHIYYTKKY